MRPLIRRRQRRSSRAFWPRGVDPRPVLVDHPGRQLRGRPARRSPEAAVEFEVEEALALTEASVPSARCHRDSVYDVVGRVVAIEADVWVLDVGISIFSNRAPPRGLAVGDWVAGRAWLGVDPFFYFERLGKRASLPPLIYPWLVSEIRRQTAPFVPAGPRVRVRDASNLGWRRFEHTGRVGRRRRKRGVPAALRAPLRSTAPCEDDGIVVRP